MAAPIRHRSTLASALVVVLGATLAAGCHSANQSLADNASRSGWRIQDWGSVRPRPAPRPTAVDLRHEVAFATDAGTMSSTEADSLRGFLAATGLERGDRVYIARAADGDPLAERRRATLSAFLMLQGVTVSPAPADLAPAADLAPTGDGPDRLAVVVRRIEVALPGCPDWTSMPNDNIDNRPGSYFGCATAVNLGMMVAEPGDLARGRDPGPADATVAARAVDRYRRGKTKDLIRDAASGDVFPAEEQDEDGFDSSSSSKGDN